MKHKTMQLEFEGQTHSIDANTLVNILIHYQSVVTEANKQLSGGAREVTLKVNALKQGSFVVDVSVAQNIVEQLFSKDVVEYVAALCGVVGGVYKLYKHFKGRPVKTKEEKKNADTILKMGDNVNITINTYNQQIVRQAVSKSMETAMMIQVLKASLSKVMVVRNVLNLSVRNLRIIFMMDLIRKMLCQRKELRRKSQLLS